MHTAPHPALHWHTEPQLWLGLGLVLALYGVGIIFGRSRLAPRVAWPKLHILRFTLGLALCYITIASPLDALGERFLFSAHMTQHLLLIYPVPILCLTGLPVWLARLPLLLPGIGRLLSWLTRPWVVLLLFNVVFAAWHVPSLYEWALHERAVHNLEHLSLLFTAVLLWWPVFSPLRQLPRLSPGLRILYLLLLSVCQLPVFAYVTFASTPLYPTYVAAERLVALSPLEDQQLGGILMQTVSMVLCFGILAAVFLGWFQAEQAATRRVDGTDVCTIPHHMS